MVILQQVSALASCAKAVWSEICTPTELRVNCCIAEPEAVDLLMETEKLHWLVEHVDSKNFRRTCLYLVSCCAYLPEGEDRTVLRTAYDIYTKMNQFPDRLRISLKMKDEVSSSSEPPLHCSSSYCEAIHMGSDLQ